MEPARFSPRPKSKKKLICAVKGCNSASNRDVNIRFHYFPMKTNRFVCTKNLFGQTERKDQLEVWMKNLKIKKVNSGMKVCSLHFRKDDYILPNAAAKKRRLKTTAVPSLNLPHQNNIITSGRSARALKRSTQKDVQGKLKPNEPVSAHEDDLFQNEHEVLEISDRVLKMDKDEVSEMASDDGQHTSVCSTSRNQIKEFCRGYVMASMEELFRAKIREDRASRENTAALSKHQYDTIISKLLVAKSDKTHNIPHQQFLLDKYDVLESGNRRRLIVPLTYTRNIIFYVHDDELYDIFLETHFPDHADREQMMKTLKNSYKNVTYNDITIFLSLCEECGQKAPNQPIEIDQRTALFNNVCSFDLIDYQILDSDLKYLLVYQEMYTKFFMLKPLKSREPKEIAESLIDIFGFLGPPKVLQYSPPESIDEIVAILKNSWHSLEIGKVKSENGKSSTQEVELTMTNWMRNNSKSRWSAGVSFVQMKLNTTLHPEINKTPYEMLFNHSATRVNGSERVGDQATVKEEPADEDEGTDWKMKEEAMEMIKTEPRLMCDDCGQEIEDDEKGCTCWNNRDL